MEEGESKGARNRDSRRSGPRRLQCHVRLIHCSDHRSSAHVTKREAVQNMSAGSIATPRGLPETLANEGDVEVPPQVFPTDKAQPFNVDKLRPTNLSSEAVDMSKNITVITNETLQVDHPQVKDPGTTHEEGRAEGIGTIQACSFPDPGSASSASDWLADNGHASKLANLCKLPSDLLNSTTGMLRICSIPKDVWDSAGNNFTSGTVPKELLAKLNAPNVSCVTPRSNSSANENGTIVTGSIPSAWLLGNNDTIYIYIIPREWLKKNKSASEVEDLTSVPGSEAPATTAPSVNTTVNVTSHANMTSTTIPPSQSSSPIIPTDASANTENATDSSMNPTTIVPSLRTSHVAENETNITSILHVSTNVSTSTTHRLPNATRYTTEVPKTKGYKTTDRPKKFITPKVTEKSITSSNKTVSTTFTPTITEHNSTSVPKSTTTEKTKEFSTPSHSDSENEIAHSAPKSAPLSQSHADHDSESSSGKTGFLQPTESAAILAGVFVAIALLGYAGLLLWRRVLEKRYGNREMLVNEDDDFDASDMRHFEL